jgi:septum formation protein
MLARLDVPFATAAPPFDEEAHRDAWDPRRPATFAEALARGKAESLRPTYPSLPILAGDQIAVVDELRLDKPGTTERAIDQLMSLRGRPHRLITAIGILDVESQWHSEVDVTTLTMRAFSRSEARAYVESARPLDCCGSYRIEDAGIRLFERIEGADHTAIVGLPLLATCRLLRTIGLL